MAVPFLIRVFGAVLCLGSVGCGLFKTKGVEGEMPERLLEVGAAYGVDENTPFYFEDPDAAEPDRYLAAGTSVEYVGPGLSARSVVVRAGDGMEGYVDVGMLGEEVAERSPAPAPGGGGVPREAELPLPTDVPPGRVDPGVVEEGSVPRIRTENPRQIAPRQIAPQP